jgi:hypothetical protein
VDERMPRQMWRTNKGQHAAAYWPLRNWPRC